MAFLLTFLHFLSFVTMIAVLAGEYVSVRKSINALDFAWLKKIDLGYGLAAGAVLLTGVARIFMEKGWAYYATTPAFWIKIGLFFLVAVVSLYPTVIFIKSKDESVVSSYTKIRKLILIQLMIIPLILLCAIWMARGIY